MRRLLFNLAAGLSVFACVLVFVLFAAGESWFGSLPVGRQRLVGRWTFQIHNVREIGSIGVNVFHDWPMPNVGPALAPDGQYTSDTLEWYNSQPTGSHFRGAGFAYDHDTNFERDASQHLVARGRYLILGIPFWAAAIIWLSPVPFIIVIYRRSIRSTRARRGACIACGYDLRASRDRCPECGREFATPQVS